MLNWAKNDKKYYFKRAYDFAFKKGMFGLFLHYSLFFPELVNSYIHRGKRLRLSEQYLRMPIFNQNIPHYEIYFLGPLKIIRNKIPIKSINLKPKEIALLLYLILADKWKLNTEDICNNFWPGKKNPRHYLYQTISKIRRELRLSKNYLQIRGGEISLNFHYTTDWLKFNELTAQGKALMQVGEIQLANKMFRRALLLVRGEPFKKMYDDFSVNMHYYITSQFESVKEKLGIFR